MTNMPQMRLLNAAAMLLRGLRDWLVDMSGVSEMETGVGGAQIEEAIRIFQDMVQRGCERNVITYSSLISACEKAGRWQLALELLDEMHRDNCKPNVVTFNSLISACGQGLTAPRTCTLLIFASDLVDRPECAALGLLCRKDVLCRVSITGLISSAEL
jgi:pentatricopeptide repeat protein